MHFLDAWTRLSALDLVRLMLPVSLLAIATFLPGRRVARGAALAVAVVLPTVRELGTGAIGTVAWVLLWIAIAWQAGDPHGQYDRPQVTRQGGVESGMVGLLIGLALLGLLVAAVARQNLSPEDGRRASFGLLLMVLGLLQLMLRRHVLRATLAFGSLGLGLQVLDSAARAAQVPGTAPAPGAVLLGTAVAVALATRIARGRERTVGSAWVSDAHDLHD